MDFREFFGMSGQEEESSVETEVKKTFFKDGEEIRGLGGKARREVVNGSERSGAKTYS